ncbi:T9SS type A sorting domain-containing protein [Odoribacter sp. OttesenSCG-928-J03]|nr:T9SS type A sorting domain-containing protein [Odoribacter sp. OttesenSCG-928-J03]
MKYGIRVDFRKGRDPNLSIFGGRFCLLMPKGVPGVLLQVGIDTRYSSVVYSDYVLAASTQITGVQLRVYDPDGFNPQPGPWNKPIPTLPYQDFTKNLNTYPGILKEIDNYFGMDDFDNIIMTAVPKLEAVRATPKGMYTASDGQMKKGDLIKFRVKGLNEKLDRWVFWCMLDKSGKPWLIGLAEGEYIFDPERSGGYDYIFQLTGGKFRIKAVAFNKDFTFDFSHDSNVITLDMLQSAPEIERVETVRPTCYAGNDGRVKVFLKRPLATGESAILCLNYGTTEQKAVALRVGESEVVFQNLTANDYTLKYGAFSYQGNMASAEDLKAHVRNVKLENPNRLSFDVSGGIPPACSGGSNGSISISVTSQTRSPYSLIVGGKTYGAVGGSYSGFSAGSYSGIQLKDADGCYAKEANGSLINRSYTLTAPEKLVAHYVGHDKPMNYGTSDGKITMKAQGGKANYVYNLGERSVQNISGNYTFSGLKSGTYTYYATDAHGCRSANNTFTLLNPLRVELSIVEGIACPGRQNGSIRVSCIGGSGSYKKYEWYKSSDNIHFNPLPGYLNATMIEQLSQGYYKVVVTDDLGNAGSAEIRLPDPPSLQVVDLSSVTPSSFGTSTGALSLTVSGGTGTIFYHLNGEQRVHPFLNIEAGDYYYHLTDTKGCQSDVGTITLLNPVTPTIAVLDSIVCSGGYSGRIKVVEQKGGSGHYITYRWQKSSDGNNFDDMASENAFVPGLSTGYYRLLLTDDLGNTGTSNVVYLPDPPKLEGTLETYLRPTYCGARDGNMIVYATGGAGGYTYVLENQENGDIRQAESYFSGLSAGSYTYYIEDKKACLSDKNSFELLDPLVCKDSISKMILCHGDANGELTVLVCGGGGVYDYKWQKKSDGQFIGLPETGNILQHVTQGVYNVRVSDNRENSCCAEFNIAEPPPLEALIDVIHPSCHNDSNGILKAIPVGGVGGYQCTLNEEIPYKDAQFPHLSSGFYHFYLRDENGCIYEADCTLINPSSLAIFALLELPSSHDASDGSIRIGFSGGTPPYTYMYSDPYDRFDESRLGFFDIPAGRETYHVQLYDDANCSVDTTYRLVYPLTAEVTIVDSISCYGKSDGSLQVLITGGIGPDYKTFWHKYGDKEEEEYEPFSLEREVYGLSTGYYWVEVEDEEGNRVVSDMFLLSEPEVLVVDEEIWHISCYEQKDGAISQYVVGGTYPYRYFWYSNNALLSEYDTLLSNIAGLSPGRYTCVIKDSRQCSVTANYKIEEPEVLQLICITRSPSFYGGDDGSACVKVSGGVAPYQYVWNDESMTDSIIGNLKASVHPLSVSVIDANACVLVDSFMIYDPIIPEIKENKQIVCAGEKSGELHVSVRGGCSGAYVYNWQLESSIDTMSYTSCDHFLRGVGEGTYRLQVSDSVGNRSDPVYYTIKPVAPLGVLIETRPAPCKGERGGIAKAVPYGGEQPYVLQWSNQATTDQVEDLIEGEHYVRVSDNRGCVITRAVTITSVDKMQASFDVRSPLAYGGDDGMIHIRMQGGTPPYFYDWEGNDSQGDSISGISSGEYHVRIRDKNACEIKEKVIVSEPQPLSVDVHCKKRVSCNESADGCLEAYAKGGIGRYAYYWYKTNNGKKLIREGRIADSLLPGSYVVKVVDENRVEIVSDIMILDQPPSLELEMYSSDLACKGDSDAYMQVYTKGGEAPYWFRWNTGSINERIAGLGEGEYSVEVKDRRGCVKSLSDHITAPDSLKVSTSAFSPSCYAGENGTISWHVEGGTAPYLLQLNGKDVFDGVISGLEAGEYRLRVTDTKGCLAEECDTLIDPSRFIIHWDGDSALICKNQTYLLEIPNIKKGFTCRWFYKDVYFSDQMFVEIACEGDYRVEVTTEQGCFSEGSFKLIVEDMEITANFAIATEIAREEIVKVVNTTHPDPDEVEWIIPMDPDVLLLADEHEYTELIFYRCTTYNIGIKTFMGRCVETCYKPVNVVEEATMNSRTFSGGAFIEEFKVWPNPSNGHFNLSVKLREHADIRLYVINVRGDVVDEKIFKGNDRYKITYYLNINPGVYIIHLLSGGNRETIKVLIQ